MIIIVQCTGFLIGQNSFMHTPHSSFCGVRLCAEMQPFLDEWPHLFEVPEVMQESMWHDELIGVANLVNARLDKAYTCPTIWVPNISSAWARCSWKRFDLI